MIRYLTLVFLVALPSLAGADTYVRCTKAEAETIARAVSDAKRLSTSAAAAVGDTPIYEIWFGKYSSANAEVVRTNLKNVVKAIRTGSVTTLCAEVSPAECDPDMFAYVYDDQPFRLHICPEFFSLPNMANLRPGQLASSFGTRAGTIIHEITHFNTIADTQDHCYGRDVCSDMAQDDPLLAMQNADSYQYFAEDVTYFRPAFAKPDSE